MKVAFINYRYDENLSFDDYLTSYPAMLGWNKALVELGVQVNIYNRFTENRYFKKDGVNYYLVNDNKDPELKWFQNPELFHRKIQSEPQEIVHINSFRYAYQASLLKRKIRSARFVIQHHAEKPGHKLKNFLLKKLSSTIDGFIFSSEEIYDEWVKAGAILPGRKISGIMEGSSDFIFQNRDETRKKTGLTGKPLFLWVGRLNENKDPLTVLAGFSKLLRDFPEAELYMIYSEADLKPEVESFLKQDAWLAKNVKLIGRVKYQEMHEYYNSSDYFVLGSHYEGSGFSLVEAMSCGVIPVVTDIASFRMMTGNGKTGTLWKCGDADSFYEKARLLISRQTGNTSADVIKYFRENLSYPVIGRKAKLFYESIL